MNTAGFALFGLLPIAFAIGLDHGIGIGLFSKLGPTLLVLIGLSSIMIAISPCNSEDLEVTTAGKIHGAFVAMAVITMILSLLAISNRLWGDEHWRDYAAYTIGTALLVLIVAAINKFAAFESWIGALERVLMAVPLIWIEVIAIRLLRLS